MIFKFLETAGITCLTPLGGKTSHSKVFGIFSSLKFLNNNHSENPRKDGFTLSEVIITVAIVGIVAAMTLPALNNKIQSDICKQKAKRVFSDLNAALKLMQANEEDMTGCYYNYKNKSSGMDIVNTNCNSFSDNFMKRLKIAKTCTNNAYQNGCIPDYKWEVNKELTAGCADFNVNRLKNKQSVYVLNDGTILTWYFQGTKLPLILIDVNGKKTPNKPGYDVFTVNIVRMGNDELVLKGLQHCFPKNTNGGTTIDEILNKNNFTFSKYSD